LPINPMLPENAIHNLEHAFRIADLDLAFSGNIGLTEIVEH